MRETHGNVHMGLFNLASRPHILVMHSPYALVAAFSNARFPIVRRAV